MPAKPRVAGPDVIAFAEQTKLDLTQVQGTGANRTITREDAVSAHWNRMRPTLATACGLASDASWAEIKGAVDAKWRPRAVAAGLDPNTPIADIQAREIETLEERAAADPLTRDSSLRAAVGDSMAAGAWVQRQAAARRGPAYALNPLASQVRAEVEASRLSEPKGSAPTLFASGDMPAFTASGVPVNALLEVPWQARHAMAAAPSVAEAYQIHSECTNGIKGLGTGEEVARAYYSDHPGNSDYAARMTAWAESGITEADLEAAFGNTFIGKRVQEWEAEHEDDPATYGPTSGGQSPNALR